MDGVAGQGDPAQARGAGPAWIAGLVLALLAILAGVILWIRHDPFERAFAALERAQPTDPAVLLHRGLEESDAAKLGMAARISRDPVAIVAWIDAVSDEDEPPETLDEALALWAAVEPDNPNPGVIAAATAIARSARAGLVATAGFAAAMDRLDRALARGGTPRFHSDAGIRFHLDLQRRLGTRDPIGAVRHAFALSVPYMPLRRAALLEGTRAQVAAYEGRIDDALARTGRLREYFERARPTGRATAVEVMVANACDQIGSSREVHYATLAGDLGRARRVMDGIEVQRRVHEELSVSVVILRGAAPFALDIDSSLLGPEPIPLEREPERLWVRLRAKVKGEKFLECLEAPEGEFELLRRWGAAQIAAGHTPPGADAMSQVDVVIADPASFGAPPEGDGLSPGEGKPLPGPREEQALPPGLLAALAADPETPGGDRISMRVALGVTLARWGQRAFAAIDALPEERRDALCPSILPCLVAGKHPRARELLVREIEERGGLYEDAAAVGAAAAMLGDPTLLPLLRAEVTRPPQDLERTAALDHAIRVLSAIEARAKDDR